MASTVKIAIYARVSTKDKGQDTENQVRELRQFAGASGFSVYKEYIDQASAGGKVERPAFVAMFADAARRKFSLVLFWSLDRFSREGTLKTLEYLQTLTKYGCEWKSHQEQYIDSAGPFRDAVISIIACIAKQERIRIGERTKAGLVTARGKGKILGRPRLQGINTAEVLRLRAEGLGVIRIAKMLGGMSRETVRRILLASRAETPQP